MRPSLVVRLASLLLVGAPALSAIGAQQQTVVAAADSARLVAEAQAFMDGYARELLAGDRAAIAARYDRTGAWRMGMGAREFESWERIRDLYAGPQWGPPTGFVWRDLAFEPVAADAVMVLGRFEWTTKTGQVLPFSYTALLRRRDGALRIRVEDESMRPPRP